MRWYIACCFEVTVHEILVESLLFKDSWDMTISGQLLQFSSTILR